MPGEFENGHKPTPGGGRPKKVTDKLDLLFEERCTNQRILDQLFPNDTPKQRAKRTNGDVLVAAAMQRATVKSDLLMTEIFDRIEGKVTDEADVKVGVMDNLAEIIARARGRRERLQAGPEGPAPRILAPTTLATSRPPGHPRAIICYKLGLDGQGPALAPLAQKPPFHARCKPMKTQGDFLAFGAPQKQMIVGNPSRL